MGANISTTLGGTSVGSPTLQPVGPGDGERVRTAGLLAAPSQPQLTMRRIQALLPPSHRTCSAFRRVRPARGAPSQLVARRRPPR